MSFKAERLLVIGLGLIGGSFARAAKELVSVQHVIGFDLNQDLVLGHRFTRFFLPLQESCFSN